MAIQILGRCHFEKILPDNFNVISVTTSRMALRDSLINSRDPVRYCRQYLKELEPLIARLESSTNIHLREQPVFEWFIDRPYFSPCFMFEHVMALRTLSLYLMSEGKQLMVDSSFKEAKVRFDEAVAVCKRARDGPVRKWTFLDMPTLQCCYPDYWDCEISRCDAYSKLSSFQFAITSGHVGSTKSNNILNIVCKRMVKACEASYYQGNDIQKLFDLGIIVQAYLHADKLWNEKNFPDALALCSYERIPKPPMPEAHVLLNWVSEKELDFNTWRREAEQVYFVTASETLPEIPQ